MFEQAQYPDARASLIEDLISRQDDVIRQLEELDRRLIATIEEVRPPKVEEVEQVGNRAA